MKKYIKAFLLAAISVMCLTSCSRWNTNSDAPSETGSQSDSEKESSATVIFSEDDINSSTGTIGSNGSIDSETSSQITYPETTVIYTYGEAEIPNIPCGYADYEGKANMGSDNPALIQTLEGALDSMVFETVSSGEYTARLIGDTVRTDTENFPTSIYVQNLRVEVEKNDTALEGTGTYSDMLLYMSQFCREYILYTDRIGSYIDIYGLDVPVIAMRYYFNDDGREVTKAVDFATIMNDEVYCGFLGKAVEGTGITVSADLNDFRKTLVPSGENEELCRLSTFSADEFTALDGTRLFDGDKNMIFNFSFADPPVMELYSTELRE